MAAGLRQKLLAGIVVVALFTVGAMYALSETEVRSLLVEKMEHYSVNLAHRFAAESVNPILTGEILRLQLLARDYLRDDEEISYVYYLAPDGGVIAHSFPGGFPAGLAAANPLPSGEERSVRPIRSGRETVLDVAVPILGGQLGSVHVGMSEKAVDRGVNDVLRKVLLVMSLVVVLAGGASLFLASMATRPLAGLTRLAGKVAVGNYDEKADVRSDDEIGTLAKAFNAMIEARGAHERDRERLLAELQEALDSVKTLSGFLPICSHCKKIRNDAGYWQGVEAYVTEHTGALFSHGVCPDCAREVIAEAGPPDSPGRSRPS